ncbi:MAG: hypothetical protein ABI772_03875, partial [Bacteroidota bacterium]
MVRTLLTLVLVVLFTTSQAQDKGYRNNKYKWPDGTISPIELLPEFSKDDAVILYEKTELELIHNKFYDRYNFDYLLTKKMRIKYLTQKGVDQFSKLCLPESFDPFSDYYIQPTDPVDHGHQPKGDFDLMNYFSARKINSDGTTTDLSVKDSSEVEAFYLNQYAKGALYFQNTSAAWPDKKAFAVHFSIPDIKPGDEVEIAYSVKHVYIANRIFFNSSISKQTCDFTLKYNNSVPLKLQTEQISIDGWTLQSETNSLTFHYDAILPDGQKIKLDNAQMNFDVIKFSYLEGYLGYHVIAESGSIID